MTAIKVSLPRRFGDGGRVTGIVPSPKKRSTHRTRIAALGLVLVSILLVRGQLRAAEQEKPVWKPIFDGKTLEGWRQNGQGDWTVEEGAMVGRAKNAKLYGHMVSDRTYRDFTLRFNYKCSQGDSGFFIRTEIQEPDKTVGLQVQCGPLGSGNGGIYDSYGRGWLQHPTQSDEQEFYKVDQYNEMIISAHGGHVTVHVNGIKSADLEDDKIRPEGVFATQMHSGTDVVTYFKDLAVLEQGAITPKAFLGLKMPPVKPGEDGVIRLAASVGNGVGPRIRYMPEWGAFGWWTDQDRVEWLVDVTEPGAYDVWLEWSVADDHAGNPYRFQIGDQTVSGRVGKTGGWDAFSDARIGRIELVAGQNRAVLKAGGQFDTALLDLRRVSLKPFK